MKGTVKWFDKKKGFGFIIGEDDKEYFAHYTAIQHDGFCALKNGESVSFEPNSNEKGLFATVICSSES